MPMMMMHRSSAPAPTPAASAQDRIRQTVRVDRMGRWAEDALAYLERNPRERASYEVFRSWCLERWGREMRGHQDRFAEADAVVAAAWLQHARPATDAGVRRLSGMETWGWTALAVVAGASMGRGTAEYSLVASVVATILGAGLFLSARVRT